MIKTNRYKNFTGPIFALIFLMAVIALPIACSKGNPISPVDSETQIKSDGPVSGDMMMGEYELYISSDHSRAEITLSRELSDTGDSWFCELTKFFTANPCTNCLSIESIGVDSDGFVVLEIYSKHPFPKGNQLQPPSSKNRDDIRVFDVRLVIADKNESGESFPTLDKTTSSRMVINSDGYTDMFDIVYDPADIRDGDTHPYIVLFENPSEGNVNPLTESGFDDLGNASGHNVMNQGGESSCDLILDLESGQSYALKLFVVMSYGQSAQYLSQRFNPAYYLPEYNCKEAWKVDVVIESNSLGAGHTDSMADVKVRVWDWQHGADIEYLLISKNAIKESSDVGKVEIEVPALFNGVLEDTIPDITGTGQGNNPLEYRFEIFNAKSASAGIYSGLVKVSDTRLPGLNEGTDEDGIYNSGFGLFNYDITEFRTYQYFEISVASSSKVPPVAVFTISPTGDPLMIGYNEDIDYDARDSYDVDGNIVTYEWDFDYDGVTFNPQAGHTSSQGTWSYSNPGDYRMAVRVTDNDFPALSDISYRWIVVLNQQSYIAPRRIWASGNNCNNIKYSETNPIVSDGSHVYILVGGYPYGERFMLASDDYGATFTTPVRLTDGLDNNSTKHVSGFDVRDNSELAYMFHDESITPPAAWMILRRSPDASTWYPFESLTNSTYPNFVKDCDIRYNSQDRLFVFFEMLNLTPAPGTSAIYYLHRSSPTVPFQNDPIFIRNSILGADRSRFKAIVSAEGDDGSIHVGFAQMPYETGIVDYYTAIYCRISADGSTITREPIRVDSGDQKFLEPWMSIAVDGNTVYIAYPQYYSVSQVADIILSRSFDNGETWEPGVLITDTQIQAPNIEHPVNIAVDHNHRIHVVWADNRQSGIGQFRNIWYDYSDNGGDSFHQDLQLYGTGVEGDQSDPGIAIDEINRVHVVWWNNDLDAGQGVWHTRFI